KKEPDFIGDGGRAGTNRGIRKHAETRGVAERIGRGPKGPPKAAEKGLLISWFWMIRYLYELQDAGSRTGERAGASLGHGNPARQGPRVADHSQLGCFGAD